VVQALRAISLSVTLVLSGVVTTACGSGDEKSAASSQPASSTIAGEKSAYLDTLRPAWARYTDGLTQVSATCPVPKVTVETMNECKLSMLALIKIDKGVIADLSDLEVPADVQPAIDDLTASLAAMNRAQTAIIRKFIDKQDIQGFKNSGGTGSPIDDAIEGDNAAIDEVDAADPEAHLVGTVFIPPS
jgi:hypothetical protein